jgi:Tfp pilus assembly protein PilE
MKKNFSKNQKGYALLFTVVIVGAISIIAAGLSNTAYKQLILSSLAKDSQAAFYQADTASDCGLYADRIESAKIPPNKITTGGSWSCGEISLNIQPMGGGNYRIEPVNQNSLDPCFRISVTKNNVSLPVPAIKTTISARGYNICNKGNPRTVEREIEVNYQADM